MQKTETVENENSFSQFLFMRIIAQFLQENKYTKEIYVCIIEENVHKGVAQKGKEREDELQKWENE